MLFWCQKRANKGIFEHIIARVNVYRTRKLLALISLLTARSRLSALSYGAGHRPSTLDPEGWPGAPTKALGDGEATSGQPMNFPELRQGAVKALEMPTLRSPSAVDERFGELLVEVQIVSVDRTP